MRKKLLFARAMIIEPGIVSLNEPTAGLDLETKDAVRTNIKKITEEGVTILFLFSVWLFRRGYNLRV